jgi:hypothetical protein
MDLDETLVAQALATSSYETLMSVIQRRRSKTLTGTVIESIEHGKEGANDKDVGILMDRHFEKYSNKSVLY